MHLRAEQIPLLTHSELLEHIRLARVNVGLYSELQPQLQAELRSRSPTTSFQCAKCGHERYHTSQIRTTRSFLGSLFNIQSAKYAAVICSRCAYTEFYQSRVPVEQQAADFVLGS
jgi:uncharacterized protein